MIENLAGLFVRLQIINEEICEVGVDVKNTTTHILVLCIYHKMMCIPIIYISQGDSNGFDACSKHRL